MRKIPKRLLSACLSVAMLSAVMVSGTVSADAYKHTSDYGRAYSLDQYIKTSNTSEKFSAYMIDFKTEEQAMSTYWSTFGANLDISEIKEKYPKAEGGYFYGGFQQTVDGEKVIMSCWDITDGVDNTGRTNVITTPTRVYPYGDDRVFGNEGNGHHYSDLFDWKASTWYTTLVRCWQDKETGKTFVGFWTKDNTSGEWKLMAYYNTTMSYTYIKGSIAQFMENYSVTTNQEDRDMYMKNIYVYDIEKSDWVSINSTYMWRVGGDDCGGRYEMMSKGDYIYSRGGGVVEDVGAYEKVTPKSVNLTITQPDKPTFDSFALDSISINGGILSWETDKKSSPMASYCIDVLNESDMVVKTYRGNRPEKTSITTGSKFEDGKYRVRLSFTDVFDHSQSYNYALNVKGGKAEISKRDILMGDVDSNGSIALSDVVALMRGTVSSNGVTEYQRKVGDINGDNTVSLKDAVLLQKWLLGVDGKYNIGDKVDITSGVEATEVPTKTPTQQPTQAPTQQPTQAPTTVSSTQKVQFTNAQNWSNVYVYAWNSQNSKSNASWPGVPMKYESTNSMGQKIYALDVSKDFDRVIFTTASGSPQTQDVVWDNSKSNGYWVTNKATTNSNGTAVYIVQPWGKDENGNNV